MPKKISINIIESEQELQLLLNKTNTDRVRGRLKALLLLKKGKVSYQNELARKIGFTEKTVREWPIILKFRSYFIFRESVKKSRNYYYFLR